MSFITEFEKISQTHQPVSKLFAQAGIPHGFLGYPSLPPNDTLLMQQKHTIDIVEANQKTKPKIADGIVTKQPGLPIAVQTADCVPLLISHPTHVAALHCGWRGTVAGMIKNYFQWLQKEDLDFKKSLFVLGPAIFPPHYQIQKDVFDAIQTWCGPEITELSVKREDDNHWQLNLSKAILYKLLQEGVPAEYMEWIRINTFSSPNFQSYRRDGSDAKRNYSWVQHVS